MSRRAGWLVLLAALLAPACRHREPKKDQRAVVGEDSIAAKRLPRVEYRGGRFLRRPRTVSVTFRGDDPEIVGTLERFAGVITTTGWWHAVVGDYCAPNGACIEDGVAGPPARLDVTLSPHTRAVDLEATLEQVVASGKVDVRDPDTVLLVYLPPGITLSDATVPRYCENGPRAFHRSLALDGRKIAYAVMPRCGDLADLTAVTSHELVESTTNPEPAARGFAFEGGPLYQGFTSAGLEPVDPCGVITRDRHRTDESGFVVQRAWSNRQASLGRDPCVPARLERPYLALVPDKATVRLSNVGDEVTLRAVATADRPTGPWRVRGIDLTGARENATYVEVTVDHGAVSTGDERNVTLKLVAKNEGAFDVIGLVSTAEDVEHVWPVAVVLR